jgi:hypothetical protein
MSLRSTTLAGALVPLAGIIAAGCGGTQSNPPAKPTAAAANTVSNPQPPTAHLRVLSPRPGAHTSRTVVVRVRLIGGGSPGHGAFAYRLDRRPPRRGSSRITFRHLPPGRHRLVISFANGTRARAIVAFTVTAPKPRPGPSAAPAATTPSPNVAAPSPTTAAPAVSSSTTTTPPPPATSSTTASPPPPPAPTGIPQNNGGDQDGDNNGGPTDGDGNI